MIDKAKAEQAEREARAGAGALSRIAMQYTDLSVALVKSAKQPGFDAEAFWTEVEAVFDVKNFVRYGAVMEINNWSEYRALLTQWAGSSDFWYNFRRLSKSAAERRVFWEIEEHNTPHGGDETVVNSMTAF